MTSVVKKHNCKDYLIHLDNCIGCCEQYDAQISSEKYICAVCGERVSP